VRLLRGLLSRCILPGMNGSRVVHLVWWLLPAVAAACSTKMKDTGPGSGLPKVTSGFATDDDGWMIAGDAQATSVKPDYAGTGGNPDGLISATDDVTGGTWYFVAPAKYLGNQSSTYGQPLRFDLKVDMVPASPFDAPDVILRSGDVELSYDASPDPGTDWTPYTVTLSETGWHLGDLTAPAPTATEMRTVLGTLTALWIRGEFNTGADKGSLDNVRFGNSP
jgi:Laminin B (Domain IV)